MRARPPIRRLSLLRWEAEGEVPTAVLRISRRRRDQSLHTENDTYPARDPM